MPGAIIFDLDGVLIDSERLHYRAYTQILEQYGVHITLEEYAAQWIALGRGPEYAVRTYRLPVSAEELRALKAPVYHALLRQEVAPMPGVRPALARLQACFPLAVATNSNREDVSFVMRRLDLARYFTAVATREDYALAKPEPDAYRTAAARLKLAPGACLVVEDTYRGTLAAHRAGAIPIAVPNSLTAGNDFSLAAAVLKSLDELTVPLAQRLLAPAGQA